MTKIIHLVDATGLVIDATVFGDTAILGSDGKSIAWTDTDGEAVVFGAPSGQTYTDLAGAVIGARIVNGAVVAAPSPSAPPIDLKAYAASARYARETGGITVAGAKIATDETSQAKITGAYVKATRDASFGTDWKSPDGTFVSLNSTAIIAVGDAVAAHVAACFAGEKAVATDIASGAIKTVADIDARYAAITA